MGALWDYGRPLAWTNCLGRVAEQGATRVFAPPEKHCVNDGFIPPGDGTDGLSRGAGMKPGSPNRLGEFAVFSAPEC